MEWLSDGTVDRRDEWVIYIDDSEPITVGALNKFIQLAARRMQFGEVDLVKVAPTLEARWMGKDKAFLDDIFAEIGKTPDLLKISISSKGNKLRLRFAELEKSSI